MSAETDRQEAEVLLDALGVPRNTVVSARLVGVDDLDEIERIVDEIKAGR